eukprot:1182057-Prorocentrum_minimum.AAC.7
MLDDNTHVCKMITVPEKAFDFLALDHWTRKPPVYNQGRQTLWEVEVIEIANQARKCLFRLRGSFTFESAPSDVEFAPPDSFTGLPEESADVPLLQHWEVGQYDSGKKGYSVESMTSQFGGPGKVQFVKGFYNESLSPASIGPFRRKMRPAFYVDIDCDLYVSTVQ